MPNSQSRILILTSTRKDAEFTVRLLEQSEYPAIVCSSMGELVAAISDGVGAILLAKEVLVGNHLDLLRRGLESQPSWSDIPIVILTSTGDLRHGVKETTRVLQALRNTTILERPVRVATLLSVLDAAVSDRQRQYRVRDLMLELEREKAQLDSANKAKSAFLANMSHEIRTPLGAVLGFTELALEAGVSSEDRQIYAESVRRNGRILLDLVNDILDLAKIEAGRVDVEKIEVSLPQTLQEAITALKPKAAQKGLQIFCTVSSPFPALVLGDPVRTRQIFVNLLSNAIKFTEKGQIILTLDAEPSGPKHYLHTLRIQDTGMGISDEQKSKLFRPFTQADSSITRSFGGTGLGLALSRQLAKAMGGDLVIESSQPGLGSTFKLSFKTERLQGQPTPLKPSLLAESSADVRGLKVLLVEDSPDNRLLISKQLHLCGVSVETATDGVEGVEMALKNEYDMVFMDVQMPRLDGFQATERLRGAGFKKPIIALTAHALAGDRERALAMGFNDYLTKPLQRELLMESLRRFVS